MIPPSHLPRRRPPAIHRRCHATHSRVECHGPDRSDRTSTIATRQPHQTLLLPRTSLKSIRNSRPPSHHSLRSDGRTANHGWAPAQTPNTIVATRTPGACRSADCAATREVSGRQSWLTPIADPSTVARALRPDPTTATAASAACRPSLRSRKETGLREAGICRLLPPSMVEKRRSTRRRLDVLLRSTTTRRKSIIKNRMLLQILM